MLSPQRSGLRQGHLPVPRLFNILLEVLTRAIKQIIKSVQIQNENIKLSLFTDDTILYVENPHRAIKTLLELTNKVSKVAQYKINIQKTIVFLHTSSKQSKNEIKKTIPLIITSKRIKCLGIHFTKELQYLH